MPSTRTSSSRLGISKLPRCEFGFNSLDQIIQRVSVPFGQRFRLSGGFYRRKKDMVYMARLLESVVQDFGVLASILLDLV